LLGSVRSYDFVGRYGGEEFLVVLNNCDPNCAFDRGEEIRKAMAKRPVHTSSGPIPITVSVGVLISVDWGLRPVEELLNETDAALYAAKAAGRNCVKLAKPQPSQAAQNNATTQPAQPAR
jgi:diguanylate cyclase (GGDEF)-like protein